MAGTIAAVTWRCGLGVESFVSDVGFVGGTDRRVLVDATRKADAPAILWHRRYPGQYSTFTVRKFHVKRNRHFRTFIRWINTA